MAIDGPTDEQLLAEFLAGSRESFAELVRRYSGELFRFLARFTGSATTAEDLVQEAFLQVYQSADKFDPSKRFKPWLFTIAANKARDLHRSRSRRPEVELDAQVLAGEEGGARFLDFLSDSETSPLEMLTADEQQALVRRILAEMPEHLREVLVLSYYHRFPYKEIAQILGVPLGTVKSRLHAAVGHFGKSYLAATKAEP